MLGVVMLEARGVDGSIRKSDVVSFFYLFIFYHTHSKPTLFYLSILPLHAQPFFSAWSLPAWPFSGFSEVKLTSDIKLPVGVNVSMSDSSSPCVSPVTDW